VKSAADLDVFADGIDRSFAELVAAVSGQRTNGSAATVKSQLSADGGSMS
jgi:hypothetical protein